MTERAEKQRIMELLRRAGLWDEAEKFREAARQRRCERVRQEDAGSRLGARHGGAVAFSGRGRPEGTAGSAIGSVAPSSKRSATRISDVATSSRSGCGRVAGADAGSVQAVAIQRFGAR